MEDDYIFNAVTRYQLLWFKIKQAKQQLVLFPDEIAEFEEQLLDAELEIHRIMDPDLIILLGLTSCR